MKYGAIIATVALLATTSVHAQAGPEITQSSEDLVCQLTGDCAAIDASLATAEKPADRGFSLARRASAPESKTTAVPQRSTPKVVNAPKIAAATSSNPGRSRSIEKPRAATVGRADLRVSFVSASAELTDAGRNSAMAFVKALGDPRLSGSKFRIEGHTDAVGNSSYNLDLSQRRAQSVVDYLVSQGADRSLFEVKGYGYDQPIDGMSPLAAANRRVEVVRTK